MKKGLTLLLVTLLLTTLAACQEQYTFTLQETTPVELKVGESYQLNLSIDDYEHLTISLEDASVISVEEEGVITALKQGQTTLKLTHSLANESHEIDVIVTKDIMIELNSNTLHVHKDDHTMIEALANTSIIYEVADQSVLSVNHLGEVTPIKVGTTTVTLISEEDANVYETLTVFIHEDLESFDVQLKESINIHERIAYEIITTPDEGYPVMDVLIEDETIIKVENNELVGLAAGTTRVTFSQSKGEEQLMRFVDVIVYESYLVTNGEEKEVKSMTFNDNTRFETLEEVLEVANNDATIILLNQNLNSPTRITKSVTLIGNDTSVHAPLTLEGEAITIKGFDFLEAGSIKTTGTVKALTFKDNHIDQSNDVFLTVQGTEQLKVIGNTFQSFEKAIELNMTKGSAYIDHNEFVSGLHAISANGTTDAVLRARFNAFLDSHSIDAMVQGFDTADFTLNYFADRQTMGVEEQYLIGLYDTPDAIPSIDSINPDLPVQIIIDNPLDTLMINDDYRLEYTLLPLDLETERIRFITNNPEVLIVNQMGALNPLRSGSVSVTVRSSVDASIYTSISFDVTTLPGVELTPDRLTSGIEVGDTFNLKASPFPVTYANETIIFHSLNEDVATINQTGEVTTHAPGAVTFEAHFESDETIKQTFTVEVYETLDENSLLDYLTMQQVSYATPHEWTAFGITFNYVDHRYESVSRYYFDDQPVVNQSKMVPVSQGIRPGENMTEHPDGIEAFNDDNVYWVVIHDTANTAPGAGALSHANYLYDAALRGNELFTSWHYTIDDTYLYQHLPETERAFHAGDGSSLPGTSATYLGGGNRNGIGIEMSINQDGDMMRTWQRTAKLSAALLLKYHLPLEHLTYHEDFSGKICPRTLIEAGLIDLFESFVETEYYIQNHFHGASISMDSHDPEYLDDTGRIIKHPDQAKTVSYTITVTQDNESTSRTFHTYLPGTIH